MAVAFGTIGTSASGSTTVAPSYPASIAAGDYLVCVVTSGATNSETPSTPSGWTFLATGASTDGSFGVDTGPRRATAFGKVATGSESGTLSVSITNGNTCRGSILRFTKSALAGWDVVGQGANDSTSGTGFSATTAAIDWAVGDCTVVAVGQRVDNATLSSQSLTATGITFGTRTNQRTDADTTGNDHRHVIDTVAATTAGSGSQAATYAYTASSSVSGGLVVVRLREVVNAGLAGPSTGTASNATITASGNATAGGASGTGTARTAQTTTPREGYVQLPGTAGNTISVAHSSSLSTVTGDFELVLRMALDNWAGFSWWFDKSGGGSFPPTLDNNGGTLRLRYNGNLWSSTAGVGGFSASSTNWVRVTRRSSDGRIQFFTANDQAAEPTSWTQLGTDVTGGTGALQTNTQAPGIGGDSGGGNLTAGKFYRVIWRDALSGGTAVLDFNPGQETTSGTTSWTCTTGQTVTVSGGSAQVVVLASVLVNAGGASGSGTASNATVTASGNPLAGLAQGTGTASGATGKVSGSAEASSATGTASGATGKVSGSAGLAGPGTGTASTASVTASGNPPAGLPTPGAGTAQVPAVSVQPTSGLAGAVGGTAYDATATASGNAPAGVASGSGTARTPSALVAPTADLAGPAIAATVGATITTGTTAPAGPATATGTAANPATTATGNAPAGPATATGTAPDATAVVAVRADAGLATGTGAGAEASTRLSAAPGVASGTGTAGAGVGGVGSGAGSSAGSGTASNATTQSSGNATPTVATATGTAADAVVQTAGFTNAPAGLATATSTAVDGTTRSSGNATPAPATGIGTAADASGRSSGNATPTQAAATGAAANATVQTAVFTNAPAGLAAGTGTAAGNTAMVAPTAQQAAAVATGSDPGVAVGVPAEFAGPAAGAAQDATVEVVVTVQAGTAAASGAGHSATVALARLAQAQAAFALGSAGGVVTYNVAPGYANAQLARAVGVARGADRRPVFVGGVPVLLEPQQLTVITPVQGGPDGFGNTTWNYQAGTERYILGWLQQDQRSEGFIPGRDPKEQQWLLITNDHDITARDRIYWGTSPTGPITFEVEGPPELAYRPGGFHHTEATLRVLVG